VKSVGTKEKSIGDKLKEMESAAKGIKEVIEAEPKIDEAKK
jgi:hypothetical protein